MHRRQSLRLLGGALALGGLAPDELLALGTAVHARLRAATPRSERALDAHRLATLEAAVDLIIPATDTPGAAAAAVHDFIDLLLADWYEAEERARFVAGLDDLDARSRAAGGVLFIESSGESRIALFRALDAEAQAPRPDDEPRHFFRWLKELTLFGYYTSRDGVEQELRWVAIPEGYDPCAAYTPRTAGGA